MANDDRSKAWLQMLSGADLRQPWGHAKRQAGEKHSQRTASPPVLDYWSRPAWPLRPLSLPSNLWTVRAHSPFKEHPLEAPASRTPPMLYLLPLQSKLFKTEDFLESSVPQILFLTLHSFLHSSRLTPFSQHTFCVFDTLHPYFGSLSCLISSSLYIGQCPVQNLPLV